jgi:hypothetical protein
MHYRLSSELSDIKKTTKKIISQYITPQIEASPFLRNCLACRQRELNNFFISTPHQICQNNPDLTYPQIIEILHNKQLEITHHQQIETKITDINQYIINYHKKRISDNNQRYKTDYKEYLRHPIKRKRPDKENYQIPPFSASENPYTLENFYEFSALVFAKLDRENQLINIKNRHYKLEADHQRERQLSDLEEKSTQYRQEQIELEQQGDTIRLKKALLKRKMEQLKHLSRISDGYNSIPDQVGMTSPEAQIEALEQLLAQKRRGVR